jgi:hypothetical protein
VDFKGRWLVAQINYKLAPKDQAIMRTQGKRRTLGPYELLDIRTGRLTFLTLKEVEAMAKRLKVTQRPAE